MYYPVAREKYLKAISTHRKVIFALCLIVGAGLLCMILMSITLPITIKQIGGVLFITTFYAGYCLRLNKVHIAPRLPLLKKLRFTDRAIVVNNHRGKVLYEIRYDQIDAIEIRELTMYWFSTRYTSYRNMFITEKCILLYHGHTKRFEDLKDVRLTDFEEDMEIYSYIDLFNSPDCLVCMYDDAIFQEISQRTSVHTAKWF